MEKTHFLSLIVIFLSMSNMVEEVIKGCEIPLLDMVEEVLNGSKIPSFITTTPLSFLLSFPPSVRYDKAGSKRIEREL